MVKHGLELLEKLLNDSELERIKSELAIYKEREGIDFKILEVQENGLIVRVIQKYSPKELYYSQQELATLTKDFFGNYLPGLKIHARPFAFHAE